VGGGQQERERVRSGGRGGARSEARGPSGLQGLVVGGYESTGTCWEREGRERERERGRERESRQERGRRERSGRALLAGRVQRRGIIISMIIVIITMTRPPLVVHASGNRTAAWSTRRVG
jgi:hypothetical protein